MEVATHKDLFIESLHRCAESEKFVPAFYERFLASSLEIRLKFKNTDFRHQNRMLLRSLKLIAAATAGEQEGLEELRLRAETHDRTHLNIRPELYDFWREAIIATAREFDSEWNETIEDSWQQILGHVIFHMTKHY